MLHTLNVDRISAIDLGNAVRHLDPQTAGQIEVTCDAIVVERRIREVSR